MAQITIDYGNISGGKGLPKDGFNLSWLVQVDATSSTYTIPSDTDFIIIVSEGMGNHLNEFVDNSSNSGTYSNVLNKVGDSCQVDSNIYLGSKQSVTQTFSWVNQTTISITRSSGSGATNIFGFKYL